LTRSKWLPNKFKHHPQIEKAPRINGGAFLFPEIDGAAPLSRVNPMQPDFLRTPIMHNADRVAVRDAHNTPQSLRH
jgi:hypothetical protein